MDDDDHWSEASKAVRAWARAECPPFREPLDRDKHKEWTSAVMNDDEPLVRSIDLRVVRQERAVGAADADVAAPPGAQAEHLLWDVSEPGGRRAPHGGASV